MANSNPANTHALNFADSFVRRDSSFAVDNISDAVSKMPLPKVEVGIDALVPKQMALKIEAASVKKAKEVDYISLFLMAVHGGMFFSFGAAFYQVVLAGTPVAYGILQFAAGIAFTTGMTMVVLCGAEMFTGNVLIIMAWLTKRVSTLEVLINWFIVFVGNFCGALIIAILQMWGRTNENGTPKGAVGFSALQIANVKCSMGWGQVYCLGLLCNLLCGWAVWMTVSGRTALDKVMVLILPITAFAAMGMEHVVANMYFIPSALIIRTYGSSSFWNALDVVTPGMVQPITSNTVYAYSPVNPFSVKVVALSIPYCIKPGWWNLTIGRMIWQNLIPVTIGNISGCIVFIAMIYWYLYLRDEDHKSRVEWYMGGIPMWASPPQGNRGKGGINGKKKKNGKKNGKAAADAADAAAAPAAAATASTPTPEPGPVLGAPVGGSSTPASYYPPPPPAVNQEPYYPPPSGYSPVGPSGPFSSQDQFYYQPTALPPSSLGSQRSPYDPPGVGNSQRGSLDGMPQLGDPMMADPNAETEGLLSY